jgi:hypothetical protein
MGDGPEGHLLGQPTKIADVPDREPAYEPCAPNPSFGIGPVYPETVPRRVIPSKSLTS